MSEEALKLIGKGISLQSFFFEFEHNASILLDRLVHSKKVTVQRSKKHRMTVILPTGEYLDETEDNDPY